MSTRCCTLVSQLPEAQFISWGWRLPFLASLALVIVGLFIRLKITESPAFARAKEAGVHVRQPIVEVLRRYPRQILLSAGVRFVDNVLYYVFATFALTADQPTAPLVDRLGDHLRSRPFTIDTLTLVVQSEPQRSWI